jgi:dTDP-4-dehydrorhamnose reductase
MGKTFSTPKLAYQAEHENQRRWLTFDLLCGMVDRHHPWWRIFRDHGIAEADLELFLEADAAPDIIGINHYLTSDRYLDQRLEHYPEHHWGGNGRHRYADAEAVRMPLDPKELGPLARLRETWERYRRPIAVTEAHHGCTRDEQLRWLVDVWQAAQILRQEGADIRAVTVWSLFGTMDWSSLLTQKNDHYEPGPFDVRGPEPRRTALAQATEALAREGRFDHPVLDRAGWWKRDIRFYRAPARRSNACRLVGSPRQLLITGATGTLGRAFSRICNLRGLDHILSSRSDMNIVDPDHVRAALACQRPWAVINTAGYVRVAEAEGEPDRCFRENAEGAAILAEVCAELGIPFITFSSDLVFDGRLGRSYRESDAVSPKTVYGASKAEAETRVLAAHDRALVVRTSAFFGPWDRYNFAWAALHHLSEGRTFTAGQGRVSPTYVPDLVHEVLNLLIDGAAGLWHLTNSGSLSWYEFAVGMARRAGYDSNLILRAPDDDAGNTTLTSERGVLLPPLEGALDRFFRDSEIEWGADLQRKAAAE